jgi:hypothetical protein
MQHAWSYSVAGPTKSLLVLLQTEFWLTWEGGHIYTLGDSDHTCPHLPWAYWLKFLFWLSWGLNLGVCNW